MLMSLKYLLHIWTVCCDRNSFSCCGSDTSASSSPDVHAAERADPQAQQEGRGHGQERAQQPVEEEVDQLEGHVAADPHAVEAARGGARLRDDVLKAHLSRTHTQSDGFTRKHFRIVTEQLLVKLQLVHGLPSAARSCGAGLGPAQPRACCSGTDPVLLTRSARPQGCRCPRVPSPHPSWRVRVSAAGEQLVPVAARAGLCAARSATRAHCAHCGLTPDQLCSSELREALCTGLVPGQEPCTLQTDRCLLICTSRQDYTSSV